jgi:hypothetical protein
LAQPTRVVAAQTTWVKWPVAAEKPGAAYEYCASSAAQAAMQDS